MISMTQLIRRNRWTLWTASLFSVLAACAETTDTTPPEMTMRLAMSNIGCPDYVRAAIERKPKGDTLPEATVNDNYTVEECTYTETNPREYDIARPTELPVSDNIVWNGENIGLNEMMTTCPDMVHLGAKAYAWHAASGKAYGFGPSLMKLYDFPASDGWPSLPHAVFQQTSGIVRSEDESMELLNAKVRAACLIAVRVTVDGRRLTVGRLIALGATGRAIPNTFGGGDGQELEGWGNHDSSTDTRSGRGAGWETALHNWIVHRICTAGWDIYEDGAPACAADQT